VETSAVITPDAQGNFTLPVDQADLQGALRTEQKGGRENIGFWDSGKDWASWKLKAAAGAAYEISFQCATPHSGSELVVEMAGRKLTVAIPPTGSWEVFKPITAGRLEVPQAGEFVLSLRPRDEKAWKAINLADVKLRKVK